MRKRTGLADGIFCGVRARRINCPVVRFNGHKERKKVMFGGGYKKKKILKLAGEYASKRDLGWDVYYREMSGLLK